MSWTENERSEFILFFHFMIIETDQIEWLCKRKFCFQLHSNLLSTDLQWKRCTYLFVRNIPCFHSIHQPIKLLDKIDSNIHWKMIYLISRISSILNIDRWTWIIEKISFRGNRFLRFSSEPRRISSGKNEQMKRKLARSIVADSYVFRLFDLDIRQGKVKIDD